LPTIEAAPSEQEKKKKKKKKKQKKKKQKQLSTLPVFFSFGNPPANIPAS
jgi:hypothetical protein